LAFLVGDRKITIKVEKRFAEKQLMSCSAKIGSE
jgi:hypothetical protein